MTDADGPPTEDPDPPDRADEGDPDDDALRSAWEGTLSDLEAMVEARGAAGFDTVGLPAVEAVPEAPDAGETDRFGLTFVLPDPQADPFQSAFRRGTYPIYEVYRHDRDDRVFLVVEYRDPDAETAILIAAQYDLPDAAGMVEAARSAGEMFTHVRTPGGDYLGSFHHDSHEKFVPDRVEEFVDESGEGDPDGE